jgi:hypothetical protein
MPRFDWESDADRQKREEAMPTNEYWRFYTASNSATTMNNNILYNPAYYPDGTIYLDNSVPFGAPVVRSDPLVVQEAVAKEETPEAWLRRRVEEICWRPA